MVLHVVGEGRLGEKGRGDDGDRSNDRVEILRSKGWVLRLVLVWVPGWAGECTIRRGSTVLGRISERGSLCLFWGLVG